MELEEAAGSGSTGHGKHHIFSNMSNGRSFRGGETFQLLIWTSGNWVLVVTALLIFALTPSAHSTTIRQNATITLTSDPDCVSRARDVIDCFARGVDNALWHVSWTAGVQSVWESLGGTLASGPSATFSNDLDVFARGQDNALWHISWNGTWSAWMSLGGTLNSDPDCADTTENGIFRADCFYLGTNNDMYWSFGLLAPPYTGWGADDLGGAFGSGPSAESPYRYFPCPANQVCLDVFAVNMNSETFPGLWVNSLTGTGGDVGHWTDWMSLGRPADISLTSDPECVLNFPESSNNYDCFVRGVDNAIWHRTPTGSWESLGGLWKSGPAAVINQAAPNTFDVFAVGTDDGLYHNYWDGAAWSGWEAVSMVVGQVITGLQPCYACIPSQGTTTSSTTSSSVTAAATTDWAVLSIALNPPNPQPGEGVTFTANVALLSSSVPLPLTVDVQCQLDGQSCGTGSITYPGPVGQPATVNTQTPWVATPGTHTLIWSIATTNDPTPADNVMSTSFTVQPAASQTISTNTTQPSPTSMMQSSTQQATVVQTQTVTQTPTSATSQATSQLGILDIVQQNSLPLMGVLGLVVVALAIVLFRRGKHASPTTSS